MSEPSALARRISAPLLVLYGLGTMVGGGIYALLGEVAGVSGSQVPAAFVVSGVVALVTAMCFAELSSRFPSSAGESRYVLEAFRSPRLATATGWLVALTGVVSAATLSVAFGGFLADLLPVPVPVGAAGLILALTALSAWGIAETVWAAVAITVLEVGGLVWVLWTRRGLALELPERWPELVPDPSVETLSAVAIGGFLSFYAYVGFEDMVNLAEEVVDVRRVMPRAILGALVLTTGLYVAIAVVAVLGADLDTLAQSRTPLATLVGVTQGPGFLLVVLVSMLAGVNGALMQVVMGARVLYGMADRGLAPGWLAVVHPARLTPVRATVAVGATVLVLALTLPLVTLAKVTASILLGVFALVDAAHVVVVRRGPGTHPSPGVPAWVGVLGCALCLSLLAVQGADVVGWHVVPEP